MAGSIDSLYPATGYSSIVEKGLIRGFSFVYSPDVGGAGAKPAFSKLENAENYRKRIFKEFERELNYSKVGIRKGIPDIRVMKEGKCKYILVKDDGSPYVRIFRIDVPLTELKLMLRGVSNYLAQPTQIHWNGKDFKELVNSQETIWHDPSGGRWRDTSVRTGQGGGAGVPSARTANSR